MPYFSQRLAKQLNHMLTALYDAPATPDLAARLSHSMAQVLGLETVCFDAFGPSGMYHLGGNAPECFPEVKLVEMAGRIQEHPLYRPILEQRVMPFKISDLMPVTRYERTDFYNDYYRPLHLVHQLGTVLCVPGQPPISCVFTRTHRDFTETDRSLLTLLQSHFYVLFRQQPALAGPPPLAAYGLTPRERQVLACLAQGQPDKCIAYQCGISLRTVHVHLRNIYAKLGVTNRTEAALLYSVGQQGV